MQTRKIPFILGFFLSFITATLSFGMYIIQKVANVKPKNLQVIIDRETKDGFYNSEEYNKLPKEEISITSPFGYKIHGVLVEKYPTKKYMIFSHGVTENKLSSVKYMNIFLELGYNAIIYDHRRHGSTGGKYTSYGFFEKFDLQRIVHWLLENKGEDIILGIHGVSMGAATTLLYAGSLEDRANFYIADCPFSDLDELSQHLTRTQTPYPFPIVRWFSNVFIPFSAKFKIRDVSPIHYIDQINKPVLFIHSAEDIVIPPYMSTQLYEKKPGEKDLYIAPRGAHANSYVDNQEEYKQRIAEFLQKYIEKG